MASMRVEQHHDFAAEPDDPYPLMERGANVQADGL
jgi:hypothetical protein